MYICAKLMLSGFVYSNSAVKHVTIIERFKTTYQTVEGLKVMRFESPRNLIQLCGR